MRKDGKGETRMFVTRRYEGTEHDLAQPHKEKSKEER